MQNEYLFTNNILLYLLKKQCLVVDKISDNANLQLVLPIVNSFLSIGYQLDEKSIMLLSKCTKASLTKFYFTYFTLLKQIKGSKKHIVFYQNFPNIANISKLEYLLRANLHYFIALESNYGFMNEDMLVEDKKTDNIKNPHYDLLKVITEAEAIVMLQNDITNMFLANTAINRNLYQTIKDFRAKYDLLEIKEIPFKENIAIYAYTKDNNKLISLNELKYAKTVTDVLRIYFMISNNNTVLTQGKFISLKRAVRRNVLKRLEEIVSSKGDLVTGIADFYLNKDLWKVAFNYLHVFEYKNKYKLMFQVANTIRNKKSLSFFANLERVKSEQVKYLDLLKSKPGYFARQLNYLINNSDYDFELTIKYFTFLANKMSTKVLLELYTYFINRDTLDYRLFKIPSSYGASYYEKSMKLEPLEESKKQQILVIIKKALEEKFSSYKQIDDVYVEENLRDVVIPPVIRNSSFNFTNLIYGSRVKLQDKKYLRVFTTWKNEKNTRIDIDLALEIYDDKFSQIACLAWHNMTGGKDIDAYHSGDLITAPMPLGATEFIDINLMKAQTKARYLVVTNTIYAGLTFKELSYCYSGVMLSDMRLNKLYDEKLVYIKSKLNQEKGLQNIAFVVDLLNLELIWVDMPYDAYYGSITYQSLGVKSVLIDVLKERMSVYDFIMLHNKHMTFVPDKDKAKVVIANSLDATINPLNFETFTKEFF